MFQISTSQAYGPSYLPMYSIHLSYCDRKTMVTIAGWDQTPFQFLSFLKSPPQSLIGFTLSRKLLFYTTNRGQMTKEYYSGDPQSIKTWTSMRIFKEQQKKTYSCSQKYSKPIITLYKSETVYTSGLKVFFFLSNFELTFILMFLVCIILPKQPRK